MKLNLKSMAEVAIFAAIGFVLDMLCGFLSDLIPVYVFGGSINIAMICVIIVTYRNGAKYGVFTGLIMGLLDMTDGIYTLTDAWWKVFFQVSFDYILPYAFVALCGLMLPLLIKEKSKLRFALISTIGAIIGGVGKFISHFLSGFIFWPEFDGQPMAERLIYSLTYNGSYMLPSIVFSSILIFIIAISAGFILKNKNTTREIQE